MGKAMYPESLIKRVQEERLKNKLTINELADKFNIGSATVKRWTKGGVYEPPQRKGGVAKEVKVQEHEPRRMGRKPTFGATDEALLSKIGEKGYGEAMTFAKWLNATAVKRPNVAISTALLFFKAWWDRQGKTSAEVLAEVATEVSADSDAAVDADPGLDADTGGGAESDGESDEVSAAAAGKADPLEGSGTAADPDSQGDAGAVAVGADDYEVCATT